MMKIKRVLYCLIAAGVTITLMSTGVISQDKPSSTSEDTAATAPSTQATSAPFTSFKNYSDYSFHLKVKEYINGMEKAGHNLLIWRDPAVNLSQYSSVKVTEFGGRLLPQQNVFSYDPYIALFNSVFKSSLKLPLKDSPDDLVIEGAVVECNPGSRAARYMVGFGAGKAACAAICEIYEPGKPNPCVRIYVRDSGSMGAFGGNSVAMLNHIMTTIANRLATTVNNTMPLNK
jgi:hypothetical protein